MRKCLLDSDTLSYLIKGISPALERAREYLKIHSCLSFSVITYYEIRRGLLYHDARRQMPLFEKLAERSEIVPLDEPVGRVAADIYAELRRQGQLIADADLLIGATAIAADAVLVTNNEDHYERVPGLAVENWMSKDRD